MADVTIDSRVNIRALSENGAVTVPGTAGGTIQVGDVVYSASDGDWERADANVSQTLARAQGIAVQSYDGETTIASGDALSVCVYGPVAGFDNCTPGANYYISDAAGALGDAPAAYDRIVGYGIKLGGKNCLFVSPQQNDPSSA